MNINPYEEFIKCQSDFEYFVTKYVKVKHPSKDLIPFELYDFQKRFVKTLQDKPHVVAVKFRDGGFSTLSVIYGLWDCMFHTGKSYFYISRTDRESEALWHILNIAIEYFPIWFMPRLRTPNPGGRFCKDFLTTESKMRFGVSQSTIGIEITNLVVDEAAFNDEAVRNLPCMNLDGRKLLLSTTNGIDNKFFEIYRDAEKGKNSYRIFTASYKEHPEHTEEWAKRMRESLGEKGWLQEIECCFIAPGEPKRWYKCDEISQQILDLLNNTEISKEDALEEISKIIHRRGRIEIYSGSSDKFRFHDLLNQFGW